MTAPIAQLDDEWENFASYSTSTDYLKCEIDDKNNIQEPNKLPVTTAVEVQSPENVDNLECLQYSDLLSYESMEDLVHTFDEKLASCFHLTLKDTDNNANTSDMFSTETLTQDKIWKRLTDNYGLVQPLNWETSHIRTLHLPALCLPVDNKNVENEKKPSGQINEPSEDKELEQQMDYHRMIKYHVYTEEQLSYQDTDHDQSVDAIPTAEQVIEELEEIIQDAANKNAVADYVMQQETGIVFDKESLEGELENDMQNNRYRLSNSSSSSQEESVQATELKNMTLAELNAVNVEIEDQVNLLSSELLQELNRRDELQYANEVKNTFISKVLEVQYKKEQFSKAINSVPISKKFSRLRRSATSDSISNQGRYLTTVIPCNKGDIITLDSLLNLIKILDAIKADSDEVPSLLTSYILKVLCPAPTDMHVLKL